MDTNGDWKSDGEITRGAAVDEILGTFPMNVEKKNGKDD
jgi:hypothetical protein